MIVETPGIERVAPPAGEFPQPIATGRQVKRVTFWHGPRERLALLVSAQVARSGQQGPWVFQIALDAEHVDEWLREYRERLYWMVGGGTLGTAILGWFTTLRGLRPLRHITASVKHVTGHDLRGRLDAQSWPTELAVLAEEFDEMLERLRGSFDRLAQFSAGVAHEFRTPLNNLMGATSLVLSQPGRRRTTARGWKATLNNSTGSKAWSRASCFIARADNAEAVLNINDFLMRVTSLAKCATPALAEDRGITLIFAMAKPRLSPMRCCCASP